MVPMAHFFPNLPPLFHLPPFLPFLRHYLSSNIGKFNSDVTAKTKDKTNIWLRRRRRTIEKIARNCILLFLSIVVDILGQV